MRVGLFVDTDNLYRRVSAKFKAKVDYAKYLQRAAEYGFVLPAAAYGFQPTDSAVKFKDYLKDCGFTTFFRKPEFTKVAANETYGFTWTPQMIMDIVRVFRRLDIVIIGSASTEFIPVFEWLNTQGMHCVAFACCIPAGVRDIVDEFIEIDEEFLYEATK